MNIDLIKIILECALITAVGIYFIKVIRHGLKVQKDIQGLSSEEREKILIKERANNYLSYHFCLEPINPVGSFIIKGVVTLIIAIFTAFILLCLFIVVKT